jgi:hypothetical protein
MVGGGEGRAVGGAAAARDEGGDAASDEFFLRGRVLSVSSDSCGSCDVPGDATSLSHSTHASSSHKPCDTFSVEGAHAPPLGGSGFVRDAALVEPSAAQTQHSAAAGSGRQRQQELQRGEPLIVSSPRRQEEESRSC